MLLILIEGLVGISCSGLGFYLLYNFFTHTSKQANDFIALFAGVLIIIGTFLLFLAKVLIEKKLTDDTTSKTLDTKSPQTERKNLFERNNELVAQWRKTSYMKDKMKMIEISTDSGHNAPK